MKFFILYFTIIGSVICLKNNFKIELIKKYVQNQASKIIVTAFLCWDKKDLLNLTNELQQINILFNSQQNGFNEIEFPRILNHVYVTDLSCNDTQNLFIKANNERVFNQPNHWLMIIDNYDLKNVMENINGFVDSKIVVAEKRNGTVYSLSYVYKLDKLSELIVDTFYEWNINYGIKNYLDKPVAPARKNLHKHSLRVGTVIEHNISFNHLTDYRFNEIDSFTKLNYPLTILLLEYLNATGKFIYYPAWYVANSRNQSNTLIGSVLTKTIDITGSPFFCKSERIVWFDCIAMTTPTKGFFLFRQPPLSYVKNIYILPFGTELWLADIAFFIISALLLFLIANWEWKILYYNQDDPEIDMIHATYSDAFLFTVGAICQQGYATEPKGTPGKILILTIFITLMFLFTAYAAYTVVLFQATADNIKTLQDMYESKIIMGVENRSYYKELFPKYTEPIRRKIFTEKITPKGKTPHFYDLREGIKRIRDEFFAFFMDDISGYKVIHDTFLDSEKCGLVEISYLLELDPWIVAPKFNTFRELFKMTYLKIQEVGLYKREVKKRITIKPKCNSQGNNFRSAGILDLYSVYMLLIIGVGISIVTLFIEIITKKLQNY